VDRAELKQSLFSFADVGPDREVWEYAPLVTLLGSEILTLNQLYRGRGDCENTFDELKNHSGGGGFTTHGLKRCRLLAGSVALIFNSWSRFVRPSDLDHRPQVTLTNSSMRGECSKARRAYLRIAGFWIRCSDGIAFSAKRSNVTSRAVTSTRHSVSRQPEPLAVIANGGRASAKFKANCRSIGY
jgi:hypothetical protein